MSQALGLSGPEIESPWTRRVRRGERPSADDLREHLHAVHREYAGFAEACALRCRDADGRNSYEWLVERVPTAFRGRLLDLGCGGGALIALCLERLNPDVELMGVDMSTDEIRLARSRLPERVRLFEGVSQDMRFIESESVDVVLCHWALTLMRPIEPALDEVRRILKPGGVFAAVVDGDTDASRIYADVHHLIYGRVARAFPDYAAHELGDPRVRNAAELRALASAVFAGAPTRIDGALFSTEADPATLAQEAANFFYASYVLPHDERRSMLEELARLFEAGDRPATFSMPVNRLTVRKET